MITSLWYTVAAGRRLRPHCWTTGHTGRPPLHHEAAKTTLGAERLCNLWWWWGGWLSGMMEVWPLLMKSACYHIICSAVQTSTATLEHSSCWTSININTRCSWWANMTCLYKIWKLSITVTIESFHSCCVAPKPRGVLHRACCRLMCLPNHWSMEHTRHSFIFPCSSLHLHFAMSAWELLGLPIEHGWVQVFGCYILQCTCCSTVQVLGSKPAPDMISWAGGHAGILQRCTGPCSTVQHCACLHCTAHSCSVQHKTIRCTAGLGKAVRWLHSAVESAAEVTAAQPGHWLSAPARRRGNSGGDRLDSQPPGGLVHRC